jgi:hypothetical protein
MIHLVRILIAVVGIIIALPSGFAADIDLSAVDFKTPGEIKGLTN